MFRLAEGKPGHGQSVKVKVNYNLKNFREVFRGGLDEDVEYTV